MKMRYLNFLTNAKRSFANQVFCVTFFQKKYGFVMSVQFLKVINNFLL